MKKTTALAAIGAAFLAAPALADTVSEVRDLPEFSRIVIESSGDVNVTVGGEQRVEVFADDDKIDRVTTEVRGDSLYVGIEGRGNFWRSSGPVRLEVSVTTLNGVEINGSGDISVKNVDSGRFDIEINGSGDVDLDGKCADLNIKVGGSGDIDARNMKCSTADLDINGSGDVYAYATESVVLDINGSGDITLYGDPKNVRPRLRGSGHLEFVDEK